MAAYGVIALFALIGIAIVYELVAGAIAGSLFTRP